jgi:two-component system sensor histidine kinase BaeS
MKSLFSKTLTAFILSQIFFIMILTGIYLWGTESAFSEWGEEKRRQAEALARDVLINKYQQDQLRVPEDIALFVYDEKENLVFSNRGLGARRHAKIGELTFIPVKQGETLYGYYRSPSIDFRVDRANKKLADSMYIIIGVAIVFALGATLSVLIFFSKNITKPARRLASGLEQMVSGNIDIDVPQKGASEIIQISHSVNRLKLQLQKERELRSQWSEDVTHDLRTPLASLRAQFEAMRDGVLKMDQERMKKNLNELLRIEELINNLEELMRLEASEITIAKEKIDIKMFAEELKQRFSLFSKDKKVALRFEIETDYICADQALLHRAVSNIIQNAFQHVDTNGTVKVRFFPSGKNRVISIWNSGSVISKEEQKKIFERLYRGEYARSTPGSGLGLTIAKRITELHKGIISVQSSKDAGTSFEMSCPGDCPV